MAEEPAIVVEGVGRSSRTPDVVRLAVGVEAVADAPGDALAHASRDAERLVAVLVAHGIPAADRQTIEVSLHQHWDRAGRSSGHMASYMLRATVSQPLTASALIDQAVHDVGDSFRLHSFSVGIRDPAPLVVEARKRAVLAAQAQAAELATAAGVVLGPVRSIVEAARPPGAVARHASRDVGSAAPPVEMGSAEITVRVVITYGIEPQPT